MNQCSAVFQRILYRNMNIRHLKCETNLPWNAPPNLDLIHRRGMFRVKDFEHAPSSIQDLPPAIVSPHITGI